MGVVQAMKGCWLPPRKVFGVWWFGVFCHYLIEDLCLYNVTDMIVCGINEGV